MTNTDNHKHYDLVVIGSGPAGEKAAAKAAYFGRRVALVEREAVVGGAGANTGTLPSKTLKESALYYSGKYDKGLYGVDRDIVQPTSIEDFMFRKSVVVDASNDDVLENMARHGVDILHGIGRFLDPHTIRITGPSGHDTKVSADHFIIATGSYPFHPPGIPFDGERIHDSDTILEIGRIPRSLAIVGAGVIGCEYATIFATMGTKVHLINNADRILGFLDPEISAELVKQMAEAGIEILFGAALKGVTTGALDPDGLRVELEDGRSIEVDMFLFAAGRSGSTTDLDCGKAGVKLGKREAIIVDETYRTSAPHIYAVGDVIGFPALASTGMDQGRVAVSHIYGIHDLDRLPKVFPYGIYTVPEISMVGMTEAEAEAAGRPYFVGRAHHSRTARGRIMGAKAGMLKLVIARDDQSILGAHVIGQLASELIHYGQALVANRTTVSEIIATVFNYPTLHELYKYACYDGLGNLSGRKLRDS